MGTPDSRNKISVISCYSILASRCKALSKIDRLSILKDLLSRPYLRSPSHALSSRTHSVKDMEVIAHMQKPSNDVSKLALKLLLVRNPVGTVACFALLTLSLATYLLRLAEGPAYQVSIHAPIPSSVDVSLPPLLYPPFLFHR